MIPMLRSGLPKQNNISLPFPQIVQPSQKRWQFFAILFPTIVPDAYIRNNNYARRKAQRELIDVGLQTYQVHGWSILSVY